MLLHVPVTLCVERFAVPEQVVDPNEKAIECTRISNNISGGVVQQSRRFVKWADVNAIGAVQPIFNPEFVAFFRIDIPFEDAGMIGDRFP